MDEWPVRQLRPPLKAYVGQTRSRALILELARFGIGECTVRGELPPYRHTNGWFFDNGAFRDWRAGVPFDSEQFTKDILRISNDVAFGRYRPPDFIVVPDLVAAGMASLEESNSWLPDLRGRGMLYLAVQDGMDPGMIAGVLDDGLYDGVFVGGTVDWKAETAATWVDLAHWMGLNCHIGRVGTWRKILWAFDIDADSIDSCFPLFHIVKNLRPFVETLHDVNKNLY